MNLLPLLIGFVLLGSFNKQDKKQAFDLSQILSNPDLTNLLPHIAKLLDKSADEQDKNLAIMNLLTNPAIFEIVQKFATKQQPQQDKNQQNNQEDNSKNNETPSQNQTVQNQEQTVDQTNNQNTQNQQTFSAESQEFFAPIQEVADKQISKKLYALYDNWYVKK